MEQKPVFTGVYQVGLVVKDCMSMVKKYYHEYGIGPWKIYEMNPDTIRDMVVRDKPVKYAMRAAVTFIGEVMIELIQPLDDKSIYAEFLEEHGDGIHHVLFDVEDYDKTVAFFSDKGLGVFQGGTSKVMTKYAYFDTIKDLGLISEIIKPSGNGGTAEPDDVYPKPT